MRRFRTLSLFVAGSILAVLPFATPARSQSPVVVDHVEQALESDNVYVDPTLKTFDKAQLESAAMQGHDLGARRTQTKIVVLRDMPRGVTNKQQAYEYVKRVHDDLNLGDDPLIVLSTKHRWVGIVAPRLTAEQIQSFEDGFFPNVEQDLSHPTPALARLAEQVAGETNKAEYGNTWIMWIIFLIVVVVVVGLITSAVRRKKQEMASLRGPLDQLRSSVLSGIEYLDNYMDVLPKNNPDSDQVRIFRQSASQKYDQAVKIMDRATEISDFNRTQSLFDRAQADVDQARRYLDRATGGTGNIPGDDAMRPQPLPASQADVNAIPQNQRGVSFFSGQPAPLGSLVPVTVTINGQSRQVLVTPEEADELRQGRMPQVRSFQQGNQWVPWYEYQTYDPYRDYWRYENSGWGGLGTGLVAGFVGAELLGSLFAPNYGYNTPWAYATDNGYYQGYADAVQQGDLGGYGGASNWDGNAGNIGGWDNSGSNADWSGTADGVTGMDAPSDFDSAINSSDAASDWSGDSGGWQDSGGGSDFGGSDFGGGGDSGGGGGGDW